MLNYEELIKKFELLGQTHIFKYWNELSDKQRNNLITELNNIDPSLFTLKPTKKSFDNVLPPDKKSAYTYTTR